jgi:hypothetical protein
VTLFSSRDSPSSLTFVHRQNNLLQAATCPVPGSITGCPTAKALLPPAGATQQSFSQIHGDSTARKRHYGRRLPPRSELFATCSCPLAAANTHSNPELQQPFSGTITIPSLTPTTTAGLTRYGSCPPARPSLFLPLPANMHRPGPTTPPQPRSEPLRKLP